MKMISHTPQPPPLPPAGTQDPLQIHISGSHPSHFPDNMTLPQQPAIIVRAEEALIVVLVLVLWVAAIALFFNRWGKIRMLEPYQPKFIQQHRPSCPLGDSIQHRSFSKFNISNEFQLMQPHSLRPRNNSVFVGSSMVTLPMNPPRKVKSAFDLQNLVLSDPALNKSIVRLNLGRDEIRRSSMLPAFERAQCYAEPKKADSRNNSISSIRRGSILPDSCRNVLSVETERTFLPPPIKSGVLDFRRNSMLIINNLTEDVGSSVFPRNLSLGGSNVNLAPEFPAAPNRRNSVIPPYILPAKHKAKSLSIANSTDKYITNQKASKSLDSEACQAIKKPSPLISDLRQQFLQPVTQKRSSLSSEALTIKEPEFPCIIETQCSSPVGSAEEFIYKLKTDDVSSSQANLLANDDIYYGANSSGVNMTVSLADLKKLSAAAAVSTVTTAQSTDVCSYSAYKVTNV